MKHKYFLMAYISAALMLSLGSCKKEADNIYNMFDDVSVTYHGTQANSVVDYREFNEGEEVVIDYTITSAKEDMAAVCVKREGQDAPVLQINLPENADKRSYSGEYKITASRAGSNKYRIYALNKQAIYIGDGYKAVEFLVRPNFTLIANRNLYLPDSAVQSTRVSYYSIKLGKAFTYTEATAASADIDFGIYRTKAPATETNASNAPGGYYYHLYSPSASPLFFSVYDLSAWTKRATLFTNPSNDANAFRDNLVSGVSIGTIVSPKTIALKETGRASASNAIKVGSVVYFKTPEGKYGAIWFKQITTDSEGRWFMTIHTKVQN